MASSHTLEEILRGLTAESAPELARSLGGGKVQCLACGHRCRISEGRSGACRVRFVEGGSLRRPRGYVAAVACDPIEKKPFFHAFPGRDALTFGMLGCDLHCPFCQNWETSQVARDDDAMSLPACVSAEELAEAGQAEGAAVLVSSYNEPLITADWAAEVFRPARAQGMVCGFVSNGNATLEVLEYLRPLVDIYKVDLKCMTERGYQMLGGKLSTVLDTLRWLKKLGFWVEVVTLVIPGYNDDPGELRAMARFLAELDRDIPWHVTAFHPDYKMQDRGRTEAASLFSAYDIGREAGLRFVYTGNRPGETGDRESTFCPGCGGLLVKRRGFQVLENKMQGDACPSCRARIPGVWEKDPPRFSRGGGFPKPIRIGRRFTP